MENFVSNQSEKLGASAMSRRSLFKTTSAVTALAGISSLGVSTSAAASESVFDGGYERKVDAFLVRTKSARSHYKNSLKPIFNNGDDDAYEDFRGSFSKTLPHDNWGEVDPQTYRDLRAALAAGSINQIEALPTGNGSRKLVNPLASYAFDLSSTDSHATWMAPAPKFDSLETAGEVAELYWKAALRDVNFDEYETNNEIGLAVAELNQFSKTPGPKISGKLTRETVFRGQMPGDLVGPYISQFLYKDIPCGPMIVPQKIQAPAPGTVFMTSDADFLAVQNGSTPSAAPLGRAKHIINPRYLAEYVHRDYSYQSYMNAALILLDMPDSIDKNSPYQNLRRQESFVTFGGPDILSLVSGVATIALKAAWYQKWLVHRRLRPEVYGIRAQVQAYGMKDYGLSDEIILCDILGRNYDQHSSFLLPMAYPEGSPAHPSYPAGHACMAGACVTVLKAFFDEDQIIENPVIPDSSGETLRNYYGQDLTIRGELNKLANNISLGRDWAGVHYRSDGIDGLDVGELIAINMLRDYTRTYSETFDGFTLTKFRGKKIRIRSGAVSVA